MKILLVEDSERLARNILQVLKDANFVVDHASNLRIASDLAATETYDVVLLDWMLPDGAGIAVLTQLRADKKTTPVILLTAKGETQDIVEALDAGADDYLIKPFSFDELFARIRAVTRRPHTIQTQNLTCGTLTIDESQKKVLRAGKELELSKREYALLDFLVRNKGTVFSKEQLAERVWNYESDILPNTVQVYITYLRKKIDEAFPEEQPVIHTRRGFGYLAQES